MALDVKFSGDALLFGSWVATRPVRLASSSLT